jgi:peptidoglycan/LPS O-acetylase OafA/YrhL
VLESNISSTAILDPPEAELAPEAAATLTPIAPPSQARRLEPVTLRKPPLPALSGLRTILAVNIMLFHFTPPHLGPLVHVVNTAYVFVGFFFLISGFVLAYNYADRPVLSRRNFYVARFARIYPVYALVLLLSIPFLRFEWAAHRGHDFFLGLILTPFALQGWSPVLGSFWNTVAWTVPAEFFLYALFPFLVLAIERHAKRLATPARLVAAILLVWMLGITPHVCYWLFNPDHLASPATRFTYAYWLRALKYTPVAYLCTFTAGVLLARLYSVLRLTGRSRVALGLVAVAGLALFFALAADRVPYVLVHGALLLPLFSVLLLSLTGSSPLTAILSWKPLVLFGETTFVLYLLHFNSFLLIHFYHLPERLHVARFDPWISYAAIMLLAYIIHRFYEQPARRYVLKLAGPR